MIIEIPRKYKTNKEKLGYIGDYLVKHIFGGELSENKFDMKKDITLSTGEMIEVKTQNRDKYRNMFKIGRAHV